jgi:hypothetical protein
MSERRTNPPTSARAIIGLIVQRSTIELFEAYGVAVAPVVASDTNLPTVPRDHMVGTIVLSSANRQGLLALACSSPTLSRTKPSVDDSPALQDWLRELTNQLAGRIKNRFGRYRVPLHVGLPSATTGASGDADGHRSNIYTFRTLKDDVFVVLGGGFESENFDLQGGSTPAQEGDVIIF